MIGANLFLNAIKWRSSGVRSQKSSALVRILVRCEKCGQILLRTIFEVRTNSTADDVQSVIRKIYMYIYIYIYIYIYSLVSSSETLHNKLILIGANIFWNAIKWRSSEVRSQKIVRTCPHFSEVWKVRTNSTADDFRSADKFYCGRFSKCGQILLRMIFKVSLGKFIYIYIRSCRQVKHSTINLFW